MSSVTEVNKTNNQAHFDYDVSKIFVNNNRYEAGIRTNNTAGILSYLPGTVLGRIGASEKLVPLTSAAVDGSQYPVGILLTEVTDLAIAGDANINMCVSGDVVKDKIILTADGFDDAVDGRLIGDRIGSDTVGIKMIESDELTGFDNQ